MTGDQVMEALMQTLLAEADDEDLAAACEMAGEPFDENVDNPVKLVSSFEDAMVLTSNRGLVVTLHDGSEYQVTIVQSRQPRR